MESATLPATARKRKLSASEADLVRFLDLVTDARDLAGSMATDRNAECDRFLTHPWFLVLDEHLTELQCLLTIAARHLWHATPPGLRCPEEVVL